jgi:hypothetical protein
MSSATVKISLKNGETAFSELNAVDFMGLYLDFYVQNPIEAVPKECFPNLRKLISFAVSYLPFMPHGWSFAWNVSMPLQKRRLFCCVDSENGTFVAKTHSWEPSPYEKNPRMSVQMVSDISGMESVTMVDCAENIPSDRILDELFKRFFADQSQEYLECYEDGEIFGIRNNSESLAFVEEASEENVSLTFRCGCTKEKIAGIFKRMPEKDIGFLFENEPVLNVECPRCGFKYGIKKHDIK